MDHSQKINRLKHPREQANIFSIISFFYTGRVYARGLTNELEDDDLYEVVKKFRSKECGDKMENTYFSKTNQESSNTKSLYHILWSLFGVKYILLGMISVTGRVLTSVVEPEALSMIVYYFTPGHTEMSIYHAAYFGVILLGTRILFSICLQNYQMFLTELLIQIKNSFCSVIYRKSLRIDPKELEKTSLGNIVTVMTKDVSLIQYLFPLINEIWISTIETVVICYVLYMKIGSVCFVGLGIILSLIPLQVYIYKVINKLRLKVAKKSDERLQKTQEALSAIKTIKMYTWESIFAEKIGEARLLEIKLTVKVIFLKLAVIFFGAMISEFAFCTMIITYIWIHHDISAADIFYSLQLFAILKYSAAIAYSLGLSGLAEVSACLQRINKILQLKELPNFQEESHKEPKIELQGATLKFKNREVLNGVNLELCTGLNVITGHLGCGKSTLIKVMLREYLLDEGNIVIQGRKSYASQDPWLFPSSIRQNILFGETYDPKRYEQVVAVCALEYDFQILEKGDETIVSDKGMNLSKGQQARINLARAIYKESDIYLLDDVLTALDPKVQDHIFTKCLQGFLKNKCVVLISHESRHIKAADKLVILKDGEVSFDGKQKIITPEVLQEFEYVKNEQNDKETLEFDNENDDDETANLLQMEPLIKRKHIYHENKKSGSIEMKLYYEYLQYGGGVFIAICLFVMYFSSTFVFSSSQKMLSTWVNQKSEITNLYSQYMQNITNTSVNSTMDTVNTTIIEHMEKEASYTLLIYCILIVSFCVVECIKNFLILSMGLSASIKMHKKMINQIVNAVMSFFDSFFIGNILNRFSQDLFVIDEQMPLILSVVVGTLFQIFGTAGLLMTVDWKFLIPAVLLTVLSIIINMLYLKTARNLKRLEAATRSPIVGHLNSTVEGLTTIRAYKAQDILISEFDKHQDLYTSAYYTFICVKTGAIFAMQVCSVVFVASVLFRIIFVEEDVQAGDVGLTISQASIMILLIHSFLMSWSDAENTMTAVERALEFTTVEPETSTGNEIIGWPSQGAIKFENVSLKYKNSHKRILKDIQFEVKPGNRIGIVGRTGAGKSTIISTLYRLYSYEGQILIDGVEINTLSLKTLRQHISIIPQDPIMFSGTIRSNIDPLKEFSDEEIWNTINKVQLTTSISSLDVQVDNTNFSTGQRQLICLARAIIRKNKIVVLDEATANMDPETERLATLIIKENFLSSTLLIVAHRLESVMDCNKILVLERGRIMEYDEPLVLLKNKNSMFSEMVRNVRANQDDL